MPKIKEGCITPKHKKAERNCFYELLNLSEINFPDGLETIGRNALYMTAITEFNAPKSLKTLGDNALYGTQIVKAILNDKLEKIGSSCICCL